LSKFAPDLPPIAPGENPAWSIRSERQLATKYPACMAEGRAETAGLEIKENRMKAHDVM